LSDSLSKSNIQNDERINDRLFKTENLMLIQSIFFIIGLTSIFFSIIEEQTFTSINPIFIYFGIVLLCISQLINMFNLEVR